ncbi:MAG: hydrogenase-4 component [Clostridiales bacterium]|jgi:hydrogenase-4 component E|nr:hydrogenase-4 component [Clostridiales bacterium]MDN5281328.1 hydrogenase-4 component [Candidatus Ozemobacter sp.]
MNNIAAMLALSCLFFLGSGRLRLSIRMASFQGVLLGILALVAGGLKPSIIVLAVSSIVLKGILLPWLLRRAMNSTCARREIEPFVSFSASVLSGLALLALAQWLVNRTELLTPIFSPVMLTSAYFMVFTGLFILVTRKKAITQTLGFLVMENGVYCAGLSLGSELSMLIELGILLDIFVGIFLMGIMIFHIDSEFEHIDTDKFNDLSDVILQTGGEKE